MQRYQNRISGPLLDRIDIQLQVKPVEVDDLIPERTGASAKQGGESSAVIRRRVEKAREIQRERFSHLEGIHTNAHIKVDQLPLYCSLQKESLIFMKQAMRRLDLSARAYHRILRLARTIADLDDSPIVEIQHLAEAVQYK